MDFIRLAFSMSQWSFPGLPMRDKSCKVFEMHFITLVIAFSSSYGFMSCLEEEEGQTH